MLIKSLHARKNNLSNSTAQLKWLHNDFFAEGKLPTFKTRLQETNQYPMKPSVLEIFQMNVGYMCNQTCAHCHVDAGPDRKEVMTKETMQKCLGVLKKTRLHTLDITGGAPEMNPHFRWLVEEVSKIGINDVIVRSNLTILRANKMYYDLPDFFKEHRIHVISSLPCYTKENTDKQRGDGVFDRSVTALKMLNKVGYGMEESGLKLDLVYNPVGASLPGDQNMLEHDYKKILKKNFNINFNQLLTLTNLPVSRFLDFLIVSGDYERYMDLLINAYNPTTVDSLMCKNTLSVSWNGDLFDCDFNQMLGLKVASKSNHLDTLDVEVLQKREIVTSQHCYGCTAGAGSGCQGAIV